MPGRRRRSRSPHSAPFSGTGPGASDVRVTAGVQLLYDQFDAMARQRAEDVKRLDILEAQLREQAREAKDYVRQKSLDQRLIDLDKEIRTELDKTVPGMLVALERNMSDRLDERIKDTESKMAKHATLTAQNIDNLNKAVNSHVQTIERHQEYLKGLITAKPGEEQTLMGYFKYLEAEILEVKSASRPDAAMCQKVLDEAKNLDLELGKILKQDFANQINQAGAAFLQQQDRVDERFKGIENEIVCLKADVSAACSVPVRTPPGYGGQEGYGVHPPPAPHSEARGAHRAGGFPVGGGMRDAYGGSGGGSTDPNLSNSGGVFEGAPGDRRGGQDRENHGAHRDCGKFCDGAPKDRQEAGISKD